MKEGRPLSLWALQILALHQALTISERGLIDGGPMGPWGPARAPSFMTATAVWVLHSVPGTAAVTQRLGVPSPSKRKAPELDLEAASTLGHPPAVRL